jgi:hypothetical protein
MRAGEFWKTYLALAVLAGLGAYLYFVESKREEKPEKPKEKVFALDKAKVKELTLAPSGGETIRLVKEGSNWTMAAPKALPADGPAADSLVSTLESLEVDEVAAASAPHLADFGLESPKLTVGVLLQGATEPLKLLLGEKLADGSGIYAKLPTQPRVFTIPSYVESSLNKKPFDLRDRDLLHVKRDAVKTLEISGPGGSYALARDDKGEWAFTKPLATRAGRWSVDSLLGTIENLRMESVAAEEAADLKPFGLVKAARTVTLGLSDGTTRTLEIGAASEEDKVSKDKDKKGKKEASKDKPTKYYARDASRRLVAVIPAALEDDLAKGMKELRAKRLLEVATYEVEGIEAQMGAQKRVYTKAAQKDPKGPETPKWKRTAPDAKDLESAKVEDALFKLGGLEVQEFIDAPKDAPAYGLDAPAFRLALRFGAAKPEASVELGKKDGAVYARRTGDLSLLKLDPAKAEELIKAFQEL